MTTSPEAPTRATWCVLHPTQTSPCAACAGDHKAGEHRDMPALPSCRHCRPIKPQHTTHADRSER